MPYSKQFNTIFVWIPKTAGTSVVRTLAQQGLFARDGQATLWGPIEKQDREQWEASFWQHISAKSIVGQLGEACWDNCFSFAIVRNPFDRLVSFYEYSRMTRLDPRKAQYGLPVPASLEQWIEETTLRTQLHYITNDDGNVAVDFIGRYETLNQDFRTICEKIGIRQVILPKLNQSNRKQYRGYYTAETKKFVEQTFGEELELFKYSF